MKCFREAYQFLDWFLRPFEIGKFKKIQGISRFAGKSVPCSKNSAKIY
jgi:hypothetical protein